MKRLLIATAALLAALSAGCGAVDRRTDAAAGIAARLLHALDTRDGTTACALLAPQTAAGLVESAGKPCAEAVLDEDLPAPTPVTAKQMYGRWAQIRTRDDTLFLAEFHGGWRVVAAGCSPVRDKPYDCTLQGG